MMIVGVNINSSMAAFWDVKPQTIFESVQVQPAL
jgi:hypothetical protein